MTPIVLVQENPKDVSSIWPSLNKWYRVVPNAALHNQTPLLTASLTPWFDERVALLKLVDEDNVVDALGIWESTWESTEFYVTTPQERWDELVQHIKEHHGSNTRT